MTIQEVLLKYTPELLSIPGVVGTALGCRNDADCILVLVETLTSEMKKRIPLMLEGFPVVIEETGGIRALDT